MDESKNDIPVIKTFVHDGRYYFYDTYTNRLFGVSNEQFAEISHLQKIGVSAYTNLNKGTQAYENVITLISKGMLKPPFIEKVEYEDTEYIEYMLERCLNHIILQVTRDCNFNCRYCNYASNNKIGRSHEKINMSWDIAKKCIDFLYNHSLDVNHVSISFYGGEPLLNFDLIVDSVEYAEKLFAVKKIRYNMTINGSLLTEKVMEFVSKYNFSLMISLDGPKKIQNRHRKFFKSGNDTFDIVYENVKNLSVKYQDYFYNRVSFNPVLFSDETSEDILNFFESEFNVNKNRIKKSSASLNGIDYITSNVERSQSIKDEEKYRKNISETNYEKFLNIYKEKSRIATVWHHNGPCIPAVKRIFANTYGIFYLCEKVMEIDNLSIGDIENGLNTKRIVELTNIGKLTEKDCKSCWAMRFCNMCVLKYNDIENNNITEIQQYNAKRTACNAEKNNALKFFKEYIESYYQYNNKYQNI